MNIELSYILYSSAFGALASLGFGVLFNVPKKALIGCAILGALGIALRSTLSVLGVEIVLSTFAASLLVGFSSLLFYKYAYVPSAIFSITGAIPMVPGVYAFNAMLGIIELSTEPADLQLLLETSSNFIKTALILIAIAAGITAPTILFKRFRMVM